MEQQKVLKTTSAAPMAFTEGVIWKQMLAFLVPIMLGAFVQQMYNTVDSMIVGRFLGLEALAAVGGSTSTLTTLLINFFAGLSSGASVVIAQDFGGGDRTRLTRSVQTAMLLGLFGGLVLMAGGLLLCGQVLAWMEVKDSVMPLALRYLEIYLWGMIPTAVYNMGAAALNALGRSRSSFTFLAVACVVNILLDLLMVGVLDLGIGGAAGATCIAQLLSALLIAAALHRQGMLEVKTWRLDVRTLGRIVRIGMPGGLQSVLYSISNMVVQAAINQFSVSYVAACTVYERLEGLFWTLMTALGVAITTFAGQNYGAGKNDRLRGSVRAAMAIGMAMAVGISAIYMVFSKPLVLLFTDSAEALENTRELIWLLMPFCFTYVATEVLGGAIKGCGEAVRPMVITLLCICGVRVAWVLVFRQAPVMDIRLILACYPVSWSLSSLVFLIYYKKGHWLRPVS